MIPAYPTGLGVVTRLDPSSTVLAARYDAIVAEFMPKQWDASVAMPLVANDGPAVLPRLRAAAR